MICSIIPITKICYRAQFSDPSGHIGLHYGDFLDIKQIIPSLSSRQSEILILVSPKTSYVSETLSLSKAEYLSASVMRLISPGVTLEQSTCP